MKRIFLVSLLSLTLVAGAFSILSNKRSSVAQPMIVFPKGSTYEKEWKKVDSLTNKGLNASALAVVEAIYNKAKTDNNAAQIVKAILHRMKFQSYIEENSLVKTLNKLTEEADKAKYPLKPVLHSIIAESYWSYYQNNRWKFYNRTQTVEFKNDDITTWDLRTIVEQCIENYELSLRNPDSLKRTPLNIYDDVITRGSEESRRFRPTLYDFLAHRAVDFFMNSEPDITRPAYKFELGSESYFWSSDAFSKLKIESKDTMSMKFYAINILQDLVAFHKDDTNPEALIDIEIKRLNFVKNNSTAETKDSLYLDALRSLERRFINSPSSTEVTYYIAAAYNALGSKYNPRQGDENKWKCKEAVEICEEAIKRFPQSFGAQQCAHLKGSIQSKYMTFTTEKVNLADKPFRSLLSYKNLKTVYVRVAKMDADKYNKAVERYYGEELIKKYLSLPVVKEWTLTLPDDGDHQTHYTEFKVPELPFGHYVILVGSDKTFKYSHEGVAYSSCWSSNISYISRRTTDGTYEFYTLDREKGTALPKVTAQLWFEKYNYNSRTYEYVKSGKFESNAEGYFTIPPTSDYQNFFIEFINGADRLHTDNSFYRYRNYPNEKRKYPQTFFFLDRAIYRPGQTVYFKGVMVNTDGESSEIMSNHSTTVTFYDVNNQKVSSLDLTTNEYGSFSGSFTAPQGVLNGQMYLSNSYGSVYFSVEDYKRPKFEVTVKPVKGTYRLGDNIKVEGFAKSYAGANIDGAEVKYRVVRNASFPYWFWCWRGYYPTSAEMEITNGVTTSTDSGTFAIDFKAIPDLSISKSYYPTYSFSIYFDVTDLNGETRSGSGYVSVGYTSMNMEVGIPAQLNSTETNKFPIRTTNLSGEPEPAAGKVEVFLLRQPDRIYRQRQWEKADRFIIGKDEYAKLFPNDVYDDENNMFKWEKARKVWEYAFNNKEKAIRGGKTAEFDTLRLPNDKLLLPGVYVMEAKTRDKYGVEVKDVKYFTVFSPKETVIPVNNYDWFTVLKGSGEPGEKASFLLGTRDSDLRVLYEIEHKGEIVKKEWLQLSNTQKLIEIPIEEKHRGNFSVHLVFIRNNRSYEHDVVVSVPWTNKELDIEYGTFRNKLMPGQKEEWTLKIKGPKGDKVAAEMVAAMYDASLDAFRGNYWYFGLYPTYYSQRSWTESYSFGVATASLYSYDWNQLPSMPYRYFDALNWFGYYVGGYYYGYYDDYDGDRRAYRNGSGGVMAESKSMAPGEENEKSKDAPAPMKGAKKMEAAADATATGTFAVTVTDKNGNATTELPRSGEATGKEGQSGLGKVAARTNLNETAFFFPNLSTNDKGEVIISFTMPEALTRWKFMGFAHTKDLKFGQTSNETVTQKELMVVPNPPRFLRENDRISFTAKISNLADKDLNGKAELVLYDAITMQNISHKVMEAVHGKFSTIGERDFSAKKGQSTVLSWEVNVPEGIGAITYRVVAKADKFSDGEEMALPVLTNRMLVTESLPLPIRGKQTKTFNFEKFMNQNNGSTTLRNHKLTLEFSSNPAWYAVQALPYMMEYPYECAEQTFNRYYANSIASHIANSSPKIKSVFESWKSKSPEALLSNLEKNQELKALMLEETPWVLNAQSETERKKRVALLFDLNKMSGELGRALLKLQKMQSPNGGWPWFEGMPDDRYITQYIVTGLGHLDHLGIKTVRDDSRTWNMLRNAVRYLDDRIREDYEWILKHDKAHLNDDHLGYMQIQYLYARSYFKDVSLDNRNQKAFDYYKGQAQKYWLGKGRYMQGMIALALNRYDDKKVPLDIMKSIKENALVNEEMGMYWKENYEGYYWYQAPIEAHALMIEAFDEVTKDKAAVEDLKVWLLKSKQTQDWKTTRATSEACYALLLRGTDWLASDALVEISLGSTKVDPKKMDNVKVEAGTGYFKTSWSGSDIKPEMGKVTLTKQDEGVAWGGLYWQYFEQLDKITPHKTPLSLVKKLFLQKNSDTGPVITPVTSTTALRPGDKLKVRIELRVDRDMEYVHMKDMRASGFEPTNVFSGYRWQDGLGYYESTRDAATNFFFSYLRKGTYVFEYPMVVTHSGDFSNGVTTIQCMYAPEYTSHSEGIRVKVGK